MKRVKEPKRLAVRVDSLNGYIFGHWYEPVRQAHGESSGGVSQWLRMRTHTFSGVGKAVIDCAESSLSMHACSTFRPQRAPFPGRPQIQHLQKLHEALHLQVTYHIQKSA